MFQKFVDDWIRALASLVSEVEHCQLHLNHCPNFVKFLCLKVPTYDVNN